MATYTVTTLDDETFEGTESVGTPDGNGLSLREAIGLTGAGDTIEFSAALTGGTLTLTNGQLTIDGDGLSRVLNFNGATAWWAGG